MHPVRRAHRTLVAATSAIMIVSGLLPVAAAPVALAATPVFINEIHYDNTGTDAGEAIEVAGPAGTDLTGWSIVLYNGAGGATYDTDALSGPIPDQGSGFGTVSIGYPADGIQNGAPDGLALVNGTTVVQFLSYEGTLTATNGPASGMTSTDIGVSQTGSGAIGQSLGLTGTGTNSEDFTWSIGLDDSFGAVNPGQTFGASELAPAVQSTTPAAGAINVPVAANIAVSFSEAVSVVDPWFTISCATTGPHAAVASGGPVSFTLNPNVDFGFEETCTVTILAANVTDQDAADPPDNMAADFAFSFSTAAAVNPFQPLPFSQDWTDTSLITVNDNWSGVPGILGFLGQDITTATGANPETLLGVSAAANDIDVIANQTNPATLTAGGVAEFNITNPVVALQGSGTADAPYLLINVNTSGHTDVRVSYNLRDIDTSADSAIQQVALQYRIGSTGNFANLPDGYVADATAGPSLTMETPISVLLPSETYNQPSVQVRIMTTNAVGSDEWVGVDDISIVPNAADDAPGVAATSPVNGAGGVALDANLLVTFNEGVNVTGAWFTISCTLSGLHSAADQRISPTTWTLHPDVDFASLDLCTVTIESTLVTDDDLLDPPNFMAADFVFSFTTLDTSVCGDPATFIHDIQGSGATSPLAGQVHTVEGIVVGDYQGTGQFSGYHLQEEDSDADANALTSEGIFVFNTSFAVAVGDKVRIRGTVSEFVSSGQSLTQIGSLQSRLTCSSGNTVSATDVNLPVAAVTDWERHEGMRISIDQELTVTETFTLGRFGEVALSIGGRLDNPTAVVEPGAASIALQDLNNRSRILLDDADNQQNIDPTRYPEGGLSASNTLRIGDTLGEPLVGVLEQRFGLYRVQPIDPVGDPLPWNDTNPRPAAPDPVGGNLRVSAMNVLNYFTTLGTVSACGPQNLPCRGATNNAELVRQRDKIVQALIGLDADVVGLMEIENDTGAATENLVDALNTALGGPVYEYIDTGFIGTDAIKLAIIYKSAAVAPVGPHKILDSTVDPDFVDTRNRPALAQTFERTADGARLTVVVNHLKSKSASGLDATCGPIGPNPNPDCDQGDGPGFWNDTRARAAQALVDWIATDPTGSGDPDHLVIGDLNAYAKEDPIDAFVNAGYTDMIAEFEDERYSFVFQGQSGYLDHALASPRLAAQITGATEWHINADEPIVLDYNTEFKSANHVNTLYADTPYRSSDHDPLVVGIQLKLDQLYLHNNPTPPTGNTRMQHPLPMNADAPTATTLFNYDRDRDSHPGRLIQKGGSATTTDRTKFQNWRTQTFGEDVAIDGDVSFVFWSAMKDFKTDKRGHVVAYLMAGATLCDTASLNPTANWQGGSTTWVEKTITFDDVDCTIAEGSFLQLRVVVHSSSADDMWFAYDTVAFPSRLILP